MTKGIHHITAIASNARDCVHFYATVLGLRLVKKTVNQDDISTYHLFFGDTEGAPGMDLTFFIFLPPDQGQRGVGLVTTISFAVPTGSLPYWQQRFTELGVKHSGIESRFNQDRISFFDGDDQQLELVEVAEQDLDPNCQPWTAEIPTDKAIRHFHSATLRVVNHDLIEPVLTEVLGYAKVSVESQSSLYQVAGSQRASLLEVIEDTEGLMGYNAAGTVHHIAFRVKDEAEQLQLRQKVEQLGLYPTEVINRYYFKSVYFRTPAGILFEIATDLPGFTVDEDVAQLGQKLALPPFLEPRRAEIEAQLIPLT